jgi:hypothetical protein
MNFTMFLRNWARITIPLFLMASTAVAQVIFVDANAPGADNGTSWPDAYTNLQDALAHAVSGDEIRVAQGIYKPDQGSEQSPGDRHGSFRLLNHVDIKGGYAGHEAVDPNARSIAEFETVLSGDLGGDDVLIDEPSKLWYEATRSENCYHVVVAKNSDETAVLDGFTITGGSATGCPQWPSEYSCGGGMYNEDSSPTVMHCTFQSNAAEEVGGGMCNWRGGPTLVGCQFVSNVALGGGAICNYADEGTCDPMLEDCTFSANASLGDGGAIYNDAYWGQCTPVLSNCMFSANFAQQDGGAICNLSWFGGTCDSHLSECIFTANTAHMRGGSLYNELSTVIMARCLLYENTALTGAGIYNDDSNPIMTNCTFSDNMALSQGGVIVNIGAGNPQFTNCIVWANNPEQIVGKATVRCSDVQGGWPGEGNIQAQPHFAAPHSGDYHLKSEVGRWNADEQRWVEDDVTSPCIDAGCVDTDWSAELWPHGGRINMGFYGGSPQTSMSLSGVGSPADLNWDNSVDMMDLAHLADSWQWEDVLLPQDLNRDGRVDVFDLQMFADRWLLQ